MKKKISYILPIYIFLTFFVFVNSRAGDNGQTDNRLFWEKLSSLEEKADDLAKSNKDLRNQIPKIRKEFSSLNIELKSMKQNDKNLYDSVEDLRKTHNDQEIDIRAAEKLRKISDFSLEFPSYVTTALAVLIAAFTAIFSFWTYKFQKGVERDVQKEIERSRDHDIIMTQNFLKMTAWIYNSNGVNDFQRKNYDIAIEFGKESVETMEKVKKIYQVMEDKTKDKQKVLEYIKAPSEKDINYRESLYRINLAFYYAKKEDKGMAEKSISWAIMGLEVGIDRDNLELIDSYLYVLTKFLYVATDEEKERGKRIYQEYESKLNEMLSIPESQKRKFAEVFGGKQEIPWLYG